MAGILDQIINGVKSLPGNTIGAPVDLANTLLNLGKAGYGYAGSKLGILSPGDLPDINDDPFGGSKSINKAFGISQSTGPVDDLTQFIGGLATPGNIGLAAKAVVLPAFMLHDAQTVGAAGKLIDAGRADQVYAKTRIFQGTEELPKFDLPEGGTSRGGYLKAVLPDTGASLKSVGGVLRNSSGNLEVSPLARNLGDVLDHPELFKAFPGLADIPIINATEKGRGGSYTPRDTKNPQGLMKVGEYPDEQSMISTLLHETQHGIQDRAGYTFGGSSNMFLRDPNALQSAASSIRSVLSSDSGFEATEKATNAKNTIQGVYKKAYDQYLNIGGELEAQTVQAQFTSKNYSQSPASLAIQQAGGKENIIQDPSKLPKLDDDEAVRSIVNFYSGN